MKLFTWEATLLLALIGWVTALYLLRTGRSSKYVMLPAYFAVIETLQLLQYCVLDRCASTANQFLTLCAYTHIAFQPLVFNEFVWGQPQAAFNRPIITPYADSVVHKSIRRLSQAGAGLLLVKAAPAFLRILGIGYPELAMVFGPKAAKLLAGPSIWCDGKVEIFCGRQLCSFRGRRHIGWVLPMLPNSYFVPTGFLHMFLMFAPALLLGGTPQRVMAAAALLTGPIAASQYVNSERAEIHEWASIWSFFSVAQVMLLLVIEVIASKVLTGRGELPPATQKLGACYYAERAAAEAETAATAVIHLSSAAGALYQRQYKQQLGGYNKLH